MMMNNDGVFVQVGDGSWIEAIPLPYYIWFGRVKCECGKKFGSEEQYTIHYMSTHTEGKRYRRTPAGMVELNKGEEV